MKILLSFLLMSVVFLAGCTNQVDGIDASSVIIKQEELNQTPWQERNSWGDYKFKADYSLGFDKASMSIGSLGSIEHNIHEILRFRVIRYNDISTAEKELDRQLESFRLSKEWEKANFTKVGDKHFAVKYRETLRDCVKTQVSFQRYNFIVTIEVEAGFYGDACKSQRELYTYATIMNSRITGEPLDQSKINNVPLFWWGDIEKFPIEVEKWKLVTVKYYNITPTEKVGGYYPLLIYNYDGTLCKNDPLNYTEQERENIVRCPYRWEVPERIQIRMGDSIIVHEDVDCLSLNLTNCKPDFSNLLASEALSVILLNETIENRTHKVTEMVSRIYNGTDWVLPN